MSEKIKGVLLLVQDWTVEEKEQLINELGYATDKTRKFVIADTDFFIGKTLNFITNVGTPASLTVKSITAIRKSVDLELPSPSNDWWPASKDWVEFSVLFENGYTKVFSSFTELNAALL